MAASRIATLIAGTACLLGLWSVEAMGQSDANFYKDKRVTLITSTGVAGAYGAYGRLMAQFIGDHLPGKPSSVIVQSMPGSGGIRAMNWFYTQGPKDGTTFGLVHSTAPLVALYGAKSALFDPRNFTWLGSMNTAPGMCVAWHTAPIKTWQDMLDKEFLVGSPGAGSPMEVLPTMMNRYLNTKMKIIGGYPNGTDILLAMERGELHGRCGSIITVIQLTHPDWFPTGKVVVPIIFAADRNPLFPETPTVMEFLKDDKARQVFKLAFASQEMDRPFLIPPGVPEARIKDLRTAFEKALSDPALLEVANKQHLPIKYVSGEDVAATIAEAYKMPADVVASAKELMGTPEGD